MSGWREKVAVGRILRRNRAGAGVRVGRRRNGVSRSVSSAGSPFSYRWPNSSSQRHSWPTLQETHRGAYGWLPSFSRHSSADSCSYCSRCHARLARQRVVASDGRVRLVSVHSVERRCCWALPLSGLSSLRQGRLAQRNLSTNGPCGREDHTA